MILSDFIKEIEGLFFSLPCCVSREKENYDVEAKLDELAQLDPFFEFIEFPEDMVCPITKTVMRDPITIPTSMANIVVKCDRSAALTWISEYNASPFDRHRVTINDVQEDRETRKRIWMWAENRIGDILAEAKADAISSRKPEDPSQLKPGSAGSYL